MTIDFMAVRTTLYNWAVANLPSGMPVIYLYPNAPRPTIDYVTLYISTISQVGWDFTQQPLADDGIAQMIGDREFILQVQGYGGDPVTYLQNLRTSLQKQTILDTLRSNGIVFFNWAPISDITELIDSRFEQRATMDVFFRIADVYTDNLGVINTVELQEVFENPQGDIVYDETFLIPPT